MTVADLIADVRRHRAAATAYASAGRAGPARGAENLAAIGALRLATAPATDADAWADKVAALRAFVGELGPDRRAYAAELIDAALASEFAARLSRGIPTFGDLRRGWMGGERAPTSETASAPRPCVPIENADTPYADAKHAEDPDVALRYVIEAMTAMMVATRRGLPTAEALERVVWHAFALVARPDRDARRIALLLWPALRRRHPAAAAVLRAAVRWHRRRVVGPA